MNLGRVIVSAIDSAATEMQADAWYAVFDASGIEPPPVKPVC